MELLKNKCDSKQIPETRVDIHLHSENIVPSDVDPAEKKQYSITSNSVILASLIEQLNKIFNSGKLISLELAKPFAIMICKKLGAISIKGRIKPLEIFQLP